MVYVLLTLKYTVTSRVKNPLLVWGEISFLIICCLIVPSQ